MFALAARWLPRHAALAAAHLFAVHPVHVEAVANVVGRAEILATIFILAAALLYCRHGDLVRTAGRPQWAAALGTGADWSACSRPFRCSSHGASASSISAAPRAGHVRLPEPRPWAPSRADPMR